MKSVGFVRGALTASIIVLQSAVLPFSAVAEGLVFDISTYTSFNDDNPEEKPKTHKSLSIDKNVLLAIQAAVIEAEKKHGRWFDFEWVGFSVEDGSVIVEFSDLPRNSPIMRLDGGTRVVFSAEELKQIANRN
jgi:hypothetical protein